LRNQGRRELKNPDRKNRKDPTEGGENRKKKKVPVLSNSKGKEEKDRESGENSTKLGKQDQGKGGGGDAGKTPLPSWGQSAPVSDSSPAIRKRGEGPSNRGIGNALGKRGKKKRPHHFGGETDDRKKKPPKREKRKKFD